MQSRWKVPDPSSVCLVTAFLAYAALYLFRTSFLIGNTRYFTLVDDQMISMRYAKHLAAGLGLVWNPGGPRVEGYTNTLWMLYMALLHLLHIPAQVISVAVEATGVVLLALNLLVTRRLAEHISNSRAAGIMAATLTAFYVPLDNWAFQGTEVSALTLLTTVATYYLVTESKALWMPWILVGIACLVRPDGLILGFALVVGVLIRRREDWQSQVVRSCVVIVPVMVIQTAFRLWYFGDVLPNTYYLKLTGIPLSTRVTRGCVVTLIFLVQVAPLAGPVVWRFIRDEWRQTFVLPLVVVATHLAYNVYIGGDAWEWWGGSNRFVSIAMPLFFVMVADASIKYIPAGRFSTLKLCGTAAVCIACVNVLSFSVWPTGAALRRLLLLEKPPQTLQDSNAVRAALAIREVTDPSAVIAVSWAGAIPYFSERPAIDLLGKMDPKVARQPMHVPVGGPAWAAFVPGHLKWDYAYPIGELKPDLIQSPLWTVPGVQDARPADLTREYELWNVVGEWYVRKDSPAIHLERLATSSASAGASVAKAGL